MGRAFLFAGCLAALTVACGSSFSVAPADADGGADASDAGPCVPKSCPVAGWECGTGSDGCGGTLDCGTMCAGANEACSAHKCVCVPKTCTDLHATCGTGLPDGCGGITVACGACSDAGTDKYCSGNPPTCGATPCTPKTTTSCTSSDCGPISDGCGGTVQCPDRCASLGPGQTCGGGGHAGQCGCTSETCTQLGWVCGTGADNCGQMLACPDTCASNTTCNGHSCIPNTCTPTATCSSPTAYTCGSFTDSCNTTEVCGSTPQGNSALDTTQCGAIAGYPHYFTCCTGLATGGPTPMSVGGPSLDGGVTTVCSYGPAGANVGWNCKPLGSGPPYSAWCCQ